MHSIWRVAWFIKPEASDVPFRIAARDPGSYFEDAIATVAVYDYALSSAEIAGGTPESIEDNWSGADMESLVTQAENGVGGWAVLVSTTSAGRPGPS